MYFLVIITWFLKNVLKMEKVKDIFLSNLVFIKTVKKVFGNLTGNINNS